MSVNSYLTNTANSLVLRGDEKNGIETSASTIALRINSYFSLSVVKHFRFGSGPRGTILPRFADEGSDIDYMVVFSNSDQTLRPQTYLDRLRKFVNRYYSSSEIYQSHPTVVLSLRHIRFELVPATTGFWGGYKIPSPSSHFREWISTDPIGFNAELTRANTNHRYLIKPLVRLIKYWNARRNNHFYSSYLLEKHIVESSYYSHSHLKDYFYNFWDGFSYSYDAPMYVRNNVDRAKQHIANARYYERSNLVTSAENEIKKLIPVY